MTPDPRPHLWQLRWHELYLKYTALIEGKLEAFLKEEGVPVAALLSAASSETDGSYTCIDYLVASGAAGSTANRLGLDATWLRLAGPLASIPPSLWMCRH